MTSSRIQSLLFLLLAAVGFLSSDAMAIGDRKPLVIGVVIDGRSDLTERFLDDVRAEVKALYPEESRVAFKNPPEFDGRWEAPRIEEALRKALMDRETDIVLCIGIVSTHAAASIEAPLPKPVLGGLYLDPEWVHLPVTDEGRSAKENFTFVAVPGHVRQDLEALKELVADPTIHIAFDEAVLGEIPDLLDGVTALQRELELDLRLVPLGESAKEFFSTLPPGAETIYLTPGFKMRLEEWESILSGLAQRDIFTFSLRGEADVRQGSLAGMIPDVRTRMARRTALHLRMIEDGAAPHELPVFLPVPRQLFINMGTAALIGWSPPFDVMLEATLINRPLLVPEGESLSLVEALAKGAERNPAVAMAEAERAMAQENVGLARSGLLPQLSAEATWQRIDRDRAEASLGIFPLRRTSAGVTLEQMIFDDAIISRYRQARRALEGTELEEKAVVQDIMLEVGLRYLALLSAEALVRIEYENLEMTRSNLDLARVRREIGAAGPEEIFRFEALLAETHGQVLRRESQVRQSRVSLNRSMGVDQATPWRAVPLTEDEAVDLFLGEGFMTLVANMRALDQLRDFSIDVAMERMRIRALETQIAAQGIEIARWQRSFYLPSLGARAQYERRLDEERLTPDLELPGLPPLDLDPGRDDWTVALRLSLPLFEGGSRVHRLARARAEQRQLRGRLEMLKDRTEETVREQLNALYHSYPNIALTRRAAEAARRNLELVRERYQRGAVSILDLLDAQTQAVVQEQAASVAVFAMISDLLNDYAAETDAVSARPLVDGGAPCAAGEGGLPGAV